MVNDSRHVSTTSPSQVINQQLWHLDYDYFSLVQQDQLTACHGLMGIRYMPRPPPLTLAVSWPPDLAAPPPLNVAHHSCMSSKLDFRV